MSCINCSKIRSAILHGRMAEALDLSIEVLREKIGLKTDETEPSPAKPKAKAD